MSFENPEEHNDGIFDYQKRANRWNQRMRSYWNYFNPNGDMRICKYCKCNDDNKPVEVYWVSDDECSACVDASQEVIKPLDGTNQEDEKKKIN